MALSHKQAPYLNIVYIDVKIVRLAVLVELLWCILSQPCYSTLLLLPPPRPLLTPAHRATAIII